MKPNTKFNRQFIDVYIQEISIVISVYPMIFTTDRWGTTPKIFTNVVIEGIYPLLFRQVITNKGPESFKSACKAIYA